MTWLMIDGQTLGCGSGIPRPVDEHQIDLLEPQLRQTQVERRRGGRGVEAAWDL